MIVDRPSDLPPQPLDAAIARGHKQHSEAAGSRQVALPTFLSLQAFGVDVFRVAVIRDLLLGDLAVAFRTAIQFQEIELAHFSVAERKQ